MSKDRILSELFYVSYGQCAKQWTHASHGSCACHKYIPNCCVRTNGPSRPIVSLGTWVPSERPVASSPADMSIKTRSSGNNRCSRSSDTSKISITESVVASTQVSRIIDLSVLSHLNRCLSVHFPVLLKGLELPHNKARDSSNIVDVIDCERGTSHEDG
jgi:hypothetical protein